MFDADGIIDPGLIADFIDESLDLLADIDRDIVELERRPDNRALVEGIFRPMHSIKGNAALLGFPEVKAIAHDLESILDQLRKGAWELDPAIADLLLRGTRMVGLILGHSRDGVVPVIDAAAYSTLTSQLGDLLRRGSTTIADRWREVFELAQRVDGDAGRRLATLVVELAPDDAGLVGTASGGPEERLRSLLAEPIEDVLPEELAQRARGWLDELIDEAADDDARALGERMVDGWETFYEAMGFDSMLQDFLLGCLDERATTGTWATTAPSPADDSGPARAASADEPPLPAGDRAPAGKTMRIAEEHIDTFLTYVGDLLVVQDMFQHLQRHLAQGAERSRLSSEFQRANENFQALSNALQRSIMSIRKVPIRGVLQKVPRQVRDVAVAAGKEVEVEISGEDVAIDKSLLDLLDAPLMHMARNAADHGIEAPELRRERGKPACGRVAVAVEEQESVIQLTVADDGSGIDLERVRAKAVERDLIRPDQTLGEHELVDFIFASGVSTADTVTEVSGRGVGMDVVRRQVEAAGGGIEIDNRPGAGCTFRLVLPKTVHTQIIAGYLVRVGSGIFVLPMDRVRETMAVAPDDLTTIPGRGLCTVRHDAVLPLLPLGDILGSSRHDPRAAMIAVCVVGKPNDYAVLVDEVVGVQKVVLRPIEGLAVADDLVLGGALLGDGSVALILDIDACRRSAGREALAL